MCPDDPNFAFGDLTFPLNIIIGVGGFPFVVVAFFIRQMYAIVYNYYEFVWFYFIVPVNDAITAFIKFIFG